MRRRLAPGDDRRGRARAGRALRARRGDGRDRGGLAGGGGRGDRGERVAFAHARDGTLVVTTSSSVWAFELTKLEATVRERLAEALGESAPSRLKFVVGRLPERGTAEPATAAARPRPEVRDDERRRAAKLAAGIEDEELRAARREGRCGQFGAVARRCRATARSGRLREARKWPNCRAFFDGRNNLYR